ncbi:MULTISPECIES: DNA polymerase III subunit theta [unclassified Shigella]|uniref:DNA polymerase III subunit theta n=1 Tax=unclassified Shigella TaxID=2629414 RepID=UPI000943C8C2|nr:MULTISPECIES: DNA polymerase III subunit theta [unclassified Shigella]
MNLANITQEEKDKINVDLAASGVAYKERLNMLVVTSEIERQQPAYLREHFNEQLASVLVIEVIFQIIINTLLRRENEMMQMYLH